MTIITKPISEKKSDKLVVPLVENEQNSDAGLTGDVEAQSPENIRMVILPARIRRVSTTTTLCLLLTALIVVGIGIVGGTYLYQQYLRSQLRFKGWCTFPYNPDGAKSSMFMGPNDGNSQTDDDLKVNTNFIENSFIQEEFELDLENQLYEKIYVPDFKNGRSGRFIHDFASNTTTIVDITGSRCFVMPLNRTVTLPPRSLHDLMTKVSYGYFKIDTEMIRETMRVVYPALDKEETKFLSAYVITHCAGWPIYRLEKYYSGVVKRSVEEGHNLIFPSYAGTQVIELGIVNIDDTKPLEENQWN